MSAGEGMTLPGLQEVEREAVLSPCERYRYTLTRRWGSGSAVVFIMLNPSTADALEDDPTIRRCVGFAKRLGHDAIGVVNLFAWRATDPADLVAAWRRGVDIVGPDNNYLTAAALGVPHANVLAPIIAAWGAGPSGVDTDTRAAQVLAIARTHHPERRLACLGYTKAGAPRHPLYLPANADLTPWPR